MILTGDCVEVMSTLEAGSVDAIVTDPPYSFPGGFMGRSWDRFTGEDIDAGFLHWFAGFTDGEGCFSVHRKPQATYDCQFSITLRADDRPILERIHRTLGMGTLSKPTAHATGDENPKARWSVSSKGDCVRLRDLFRAFPLRAKKARDFEEWSDALAHETGEWQEMADSRDRLMSGRAFKPEGVRVDPYQMWTIRWAREAFRVLVPGGWLIAAGAPKRVHRMTAGLEDAGFEIRDMVLHVFASGFPKGRANLKPAYEPWVMARKPGTLRELAIDACRIETDDKTRFPVGYDRGFGNTYSPGPQTRTPDPAPLGRWPANLILTDDLFSGDMPGVVGGGETTSIGGTPATDTQSRATYGGFTGDRDLPERRIPSDTGTYSRFFLIPKSARAEREPVLGGLAKRVVNITEGHGRGPINTSKGDGTGIRENLARANHHPTVKPLDLMRHLVRLVTPTGGLVLDCFAGSGTTLIAAEMEGFRWIGIEREREYVAIIEARLNGVQRGLGLDLNSVPPADQRRAIDSVDLELFPRVAGPAKGDEVA